MKFDYIVVGGGSAGCVLAARLSEDADVTVALIEAGPADRNVLIHCPAGLALLARAFRLRSTHRSEAEQGDKELPEPIDQTAAESQRARKG